MTTFPTTLESLPDDWDPLEFDWDKPDESMLATEPAPLESVPYPTPDENSYIDPKLTLDTPNNHTSTIHVSQTLPSPATDQIAPNASYRQRKHRKTAAAPYPSKTNGFNSGRRASIRRALIDGDATVELQKLRAGRQNRPRQPPRREHSQFPGGITGNNTTSPQSPSTIIAMDTSGSTEDTGGMEWRNECRLVLEEIDFQCLAPGSLLTDNLINAVLSLLSALATGSIISVDSRIDYLDPNMVQQVLLTSGTILFPIYISSSGPSLGHWLLAVLDSNGVHIELSKNDSHTEIAKAKIVELFPPSTWGNINATECVWQEIDSMDSGVAVLVKAFCTALVVELPQTLDAKLWRDVLDLLLRVASDQPYHLAWVDALGGDTVPPETERPGPMSLTAAWQFYHSQLVRLEEQAATLIRQGRPIHVVLEGLSKLAILREEQAKKLELERNNIVECLVDLDKWQETFKGGSLTGEEVLGHSQYHLKESLKKANMYIARRRRMDTAVSKSAKLVGEAIKELDGFHTRPTDLEG